MSGIPILTVLNNFKAVRSDRDGLIAINFSGLSPEEARRRMDERIEKLRKAGWRVIDLRGGGSNG